MGKRKTMIKIQIYIYVINFFFLYFFLNLIQYYSKLGNLSPFITEEILTREFGIYGKIESIKIIPPKCETIKQKYFNYSYTKENRILYHLLILVIQLQQKMH